MSLLDQKLSELLPGTHVRFTSCTGQVIEGIIAENDGKEAVSVQVTSLTTLRYSQIGMVDEYGKTDVITQTTLPCNGITTEPITPDEPKLDPLADEAPLPVNIKQLSGNKETVSQAYRALDYIEKKTLEKSYNQIQSYYQTHDEEKYKEAMETIWNLIEEKVWDFDPEINLLMANIQLSREEYEDAAESFFFAGNCRDAYCAAYQGADKNKALYQQSAALSAIYLVSESQSETDEATEVLRRSSVIMKDISGIEFVMTHSTSVGIKNYLSKVLKALGKEFTDSDDELSDNGKLLKIVNQNYTSDEIGKKIKDFLSKAPVKTPIITIGPGVIYDAQIVKYNFFEEKGTVKTKDGQEYPFEVKNIKDESLQKQVKKLTSKQFDPISVKVTLEKYVDKYVVATMKRGAEPEKRNVPTDTIAAANSLFTKGDFLGAIAIYKKHLNDKDWENPFSQIISCYLALSNNNEELGYLDELGVFIEKYKDRTIKKAKTLEVLHQFYSKIHDYENAIKILNDLMESCAPLEYNKILHYTFGKAKCYRFLKNYRSAISELLDWLDIVKRNKLKDRHEQRDSLVYIELAELYYAVEDYENAEKFVSKSDESERKLALSQKLAQRKEELAQNEDPVTAEEGYKDDTELDDDDLSEPEESLQTAYEAYNDTAGFDALETDDTEIFSKALSFDKEHLYCLLTYLNSASELSASSKKTRIDENGETVYVGQALKTVNTAVSYAFNSPLLTSEYLSTEIIAVFEEANNYLPDVMPPMLAASALYALFNTPSIPDYGVGDFSAAVEEYVSDSFPALMPLINDLTSFRENTGYGMDSFANYKTDSTVLQTAVNAAAECRNAVDERNKSSEQYVQLRQTREILFCDREGDIRKCLDIAADNRTSEYSTVVNTMQKLFIRSGRPVSSENIDKNKVKAYIDKKYEEASDIIKKNGYQPSKQFKILVGKRANNLFTVTLRAINCICDWAFVAEHLTVDENVFVKTQYEKAFPRVLSELNDIVKSCEDKISENGFDWGTESLRRAADELLSKMNGNYNSKARRYFFIDFLKGEDVLLNDSYLPEIQSTLCDVPGFNILYRIESHASRELPELHERFTEILSNDESKHDFRAARLIKAYGEEAGIKEISEHKDLSQYNDCLKQAKQRFESKNLDFYAQLELDESYGKINNLMGEKDKIWTIANNWYRICKITGDYGFYVRLLEVLRNDISVKAEKKGEQLMRQLDEIAGNPKYNFGVFSREMIEEMIHDQNFTAAEYIMSCILKGDVNAIFDNTKEPFGYFDEFLNEYATNSRAVRGAGRDITDTIFEYSGKKDLEKALVVLTNNTHKETKGGANLLKNWIPRGGPANIERLTNLLTRLGFKPVSVQPDESVDQEAYHVFCRKQSGKVNYIHHIPAFGSKSETEGFRVLCLYGTYNCDALMDKFRSVNSTAKHTLVLLDFGLNLEERRRLALKIKEEKSFAKTFIVIDRVVLFYLAKHYAENTVTRRLLAVTLPFAYYQPFVEASSQDMPPELFTGREAELTSIESPVGANLVYGGRQLGKSALLKMAKRNIDRNGNGDRAVWIEIKDLSAADALKVVCDKLIIEDIIDESGKYETWSDLAVAIHRRLMDEDPNRHINYFLLMLDEADVFIETSGETKDQPITALKNLPSDRFKLVMAGLHNLSRYNREAMHANSNLIHLTPITIRQFRREEATKLLTSILAYLGFRFTQKIIDNILASTYNYPGLIQFYCQKLLEAIKNDDYAGYAESATPLYEVTESHYKKVLSDSAFTDLVDQKFEATLFTEEKGRSNYHIIALILAYLYYTEPNEKGYTEADLLKVAGEFRFTRVTSLKNEQLTEILNEMCDLNVITVMEGSYRFATDGFRKYLGNQEKIEESMGKYIEEAV